MRRNIWWCLIIGLSFINISFAFPVIAMEDCIKAAKLSDDASDIMSSNPQLAEEKLHQALYYCDSSAALNYNLAMILYSNQKPGEAARQLEIAIKRNPKYPKALNALAYLYATKSGGDQIKAKQLAQNAVALDPENPEYRQTLEMITSNIEVAPKTTFHRPDAVAVIIGNKNYQDHHIPTVKFAIQDAALIKKYLVNTLGFDEDNIVLVTDAKKEDFEKYFGTESNYKGYLYNHVIQDRSDIFIYYSGHGAPDTNTKKAYLVPTTADPSYINFTAYSLDVLYGNLEKLDNDKKPKSITVVLDSCFSGGSNGGMIIRDASPIFIETTTPLLAMDNAVIFTSSQGDQISSWYTEKQHGLFTYFFLKAIKTAAENGAQLTAEDMGKALQEPGSIDDYAQKLYNREQVPQITGNKKITLVP
jgi:tetratricopeptide (TPR) repeat protein